MKSTGYLVGLLLLCQSAWTQQSIHGTILDKDSRTPLVGAHIEIADAGAAWAAVSDELGHFLINDVPYGHHDVVVRYLGYEPRKLESVLFTPSKEVVLEIYLQESISDLSTVEVTAGAETEPVNPMYLSSTYPMSVEALQRQPANFADPARMSLNFPGVAIAGDDLSNEIVVRGNAPGGLLWRLEGVEIPNPNHFAMRGSSGGGISMLSANVMGNSDFFAGAFPAEYGNALSGVFDIHLRSGNTSRRETSIQAGLLGLELAAEGPFRQGGGSSYLFNYRYSTLGILEKIGLNPAGGSIPDFQDLSFKLNFPTRKAGTFSLFGLGGTFLEKETSGFGSELHRYRNYGHTGVLGLAHRWPVSSKTYIKTVLSGSKADLRYEDGTDQNGILEKHSEELFRDAAARISVLLHHKINAAHSFRIGGIISRLDYKLLFTEEDREWIVTENEIIQNWLGTWTTFLNSRGKAGAQQAFAQWKGALLPAVTFNLGLHFLRSGINRDASWEPRFGLRWLLSDRQSLSLGAGLHSRMEALPVYFAERFPEGQMPVQPHRELPLQQAQHLILGFEQALGTSTKLKVEAYWQGLHRLPVSSDPADTYALMNEDFYSIFYREDSLVAKGKGRNYGLDLSLHRAFSGHYYYLVNASVYQSEYKTLEGRWHSSRYNANYNFVALGGREFLLGKQQKNTLGLNVRFLLKGGLRYTPIDAAASIREGRRVVSMDAYSGRLPAYWRIDCGIYFRKFSGSLLQRLSLDVQNLTNRLNVADRQESLDPRDPGRIRVMDAVQTGLIPVLSYRLEF